MESKFHLGFFPTPFEKMENLSSLYPDYNFYIKRDDQTGLATGGNKTRKLEYLIQDAINHNCDTIITAGAQQSNHCRQTAAACAKANLNCHLLLGGNEPLSYNGNLFLSKKLGATLHFTGDNRKGEDFDSLFLKCKEDGLKPYIIPYGGSNLLGAMGYVNAMKELHTQLQQEKLTIDAIFFPSSSGGTQAGIIIGKLLYNMNVKLYPISVDKKDFIGNKVRDKIQDIVNEGIEKLYIKDKLNIEECNLIKGYSEAGYGVITKNEIEAIDLLAKSEGIILDPVYSGRAFYGMIDLLHKNELPKGSNILFWHTGGTSAIFNYTSQLLTTK